MEKYLIIKRKDICYQSYEYFADSLTNELRKSGHEVDAFCLTNENFDDLEKYAGQSYKACLEFNSSLPKAVMDDDTYFLDHIDAPFYDFILDHPLYHHDMLKQKLKNFHVLCLDENHKTYIERYYPHIKSVHVLSVTGEEWQANIPFEKRSIELLFTGTYMNPQDIQAAIDKAPLPIKEDITFLINMMLTHPEMTQDDALQIRMKDSDIINPRNFPAIMRNYFLADTFIRAYMREKIITSLVNAGVPLTLYGAGWDKLFPEKQASLTIHPGIPYQDIFSVMAQSKIVLNIMPLFKAGTHDRIFAAMLNHNISLTDTSSYLDTLFCAGKDIIYYDLNGIEKLPEQIKELLDNPEKMKELSEAGYEKARKNHTWENRMKQMLDIMNA